MLIKLIIIIDFSYESNGVIFITYSAITGRGITMTNFNICLQELQDEYNRYFESKMADTLIKPLSNLLSIKKVSSAILHFLETNKASVISQIQNCPEIREELYGEKYYGHLDTADSIKLNSNEIYLQLIDQLRNSETKTSQVIHIHVIFIQRIFDHLLNKDILESKKEFTHKKMELCKTLFTSELFATANRGRVESNTKFFLSTNPGINRNRYFKSKFNETEKHSKAIYRFFPDKQSVFFKSISSANIPFVAGASGHMGSLLLGALLYGELSAIELHEYSFVCALSLIHGGNHSFHEAMLVARQVEIPYLIGNYASAIPESVKKMSEFDGLIKKFPEFLFAESIASCRIQITK